MNRLFIIVVAACILAPSVAYSQSKIYKTVTNDTVEKILQGLEIKFQKEEKKNKDVAIMPPVMIPLAKGASRKFMDALGRTSVQNKFPRTLDDRGRDLLKTFARGKAVGPA